MYLKFWGTRGSIPVPGNKTIKYGGNTPCVELRTDNNNIFILDAGSGIRELGKHLKEEDFRKDITILLTHYHWDHIQGIPFFMPLYSEQNKIIFIGESNKERSIETLLSGQMDEHYFPVKINQVKSRIEFENISSGNLRIFDDIELQAIRANHSSPALAFKIQVSGKSIVYMPDNELIKESLNLSHSFAGLKNLNADLIQFCKDCDYLIHDTFYDENNAFTKKGWGHTSNSILAYFSILANVKNLILFHFNPDYDDNKMDEIYKETSKIIKNEKSNVICVAATEGLKLDI